MFIKRRRRDIRNLYREYRRSFWILVGATFIDRLGGALLFPFFALYITQKFNVGMTEVGVLFALFSLSSFIGSFLGGALTDRVGRRRILIFGLLASSFSTLLMGFIESLQAFYVLALIAGIFTDVAGPAHQAMVADLVPEQKRAEGFGIMRVAFNLAVVIGPAIGGLMAARSYQLLFVSDAIISTITAGIVYFFLRETKPQARSDARPETVGATFKGYGRVLRDSTFMLFVFMCILMGLVYMNMNTTLGVFLRDVYAVPEAGYGALLSINALLVVLLQFPISHRITDRPPLLMMAFGTDFVRRGFWHVRDGIEQRGFRPGDGDHHVRRNDRLAGGAVAGGALRAGGHARALYGDLRHFVEHSLHDRAAVGRTDSGQPESQSAVVCGGLHRLLVRAGLPVSASPGARDRSHPGVGRGLMTSCYARTRPEHSIGQRSIVIAGMSARADVWLPRSRSGSVSVESQVGAGSCFAMQLVASDSQGIVR